MARRSTCHAPTRAFNRIAYSAAHVVADPLRAGELNAAPAIDWERTVEGTRDIPDAAIASSVGTDHVTAASVSSCDQVIRAYAEQLEAVQRMGGRVILMASRALARVARLAPRKTIGASTVKCWPCAISR